MTRFVLTACHFVVQMELCRLYSGTSFEGLYRIFLKNEKWCMDKAQCLHVRWYLFLMRSPSQVAVPQNSSLSDGLVNQQQQQYVAPDHYTSKPAPQQYVPLSRIHSLGHQFFLPPLTLFLSSDKPPFLLQLMCHLLPLPAMEQRPLPHFHRLFHPLQCLRWMLPWACCLQMLHNSLPIHRLIGPCNLLLTLSQFPSGSQIQQLN